MAKKQFDNVVTNITRPSQRVSSISELLDDEKNSDIEESPDSIQIAHKEDKANVIQPILDDKVNVVLTFSKKHGQDASQELKKNYPSSNMVVRDGFSMPDHDYQLIEILIKKAGLLGHSINKSEVLRAGLQILSKLNEGGFSEALQGVVKIKPGRKVG